MFMSPNGIDQVSAALVAAQAELEMAKKDSKNPFFKSKYADLNSIIEASLPILNKHGIAVSQGVITENGITCGETVLLHTSGQFIGYRSELVVAKQNDPQARGGAETYYRRYALQSAVCLGAEDDDGETAMGRPAPAAAKVTQEVKVDTASLMKKISSAASVLFAKNESSPEALTKYLKDTYGVTAKEKLSPEQAQEFFNYLDQQTKGNK